MNNNSIIEVIQRRSSWRSYDVYSSIPSDVLTTLKVYINSKNHVGPFGNSARFEILKIPESEKNKVNSEYGTYGFIKGVEYFITGAIPKNKMALEDFGYLFEHIILKATDLNLGTCWLGGTFKRSTIARDIQLREGEIIPAITPIGIPSVNRRILEKIIRLAIRAKIRKPWDELFFNDFFNPLDSSSLDKSLTNALEMVRLAPSAKNKQPWRLIKDSDNKVHFFLEIDPRIGHVQSYQRLDIGIAMSHFELTMRNYEKNGIWKILNPEFEFNPKKYEYVTSWIEQNS
jgi:hypothetical protein